MIDDDLLRNPAFVAWAKELLALPKVRRNAEVGRILKLACPPEKKKRGTTKTAYRVLEREDEAPEFLEALGSSGLSDREFARGMAGYWQAKEQHGTPNRHMAHSGKIYRDKVLTYLKDHPLPAGRELTEQELRDRRKALSLLALEAAASPPSGMRKKSLSGVKTLCNKLSILRRKTKA